MINKCGENVTAASDQQEHITVCICTYRRQEMLNRLLRGIEKQKSNNLFTYSIVVVDNDKNQTAKIVVDEFTKQCKVEVQYDVVMEQNIALARNRAVELSRGKYIALIDDDEYPNDTWLLSLYIACTQYSADGVLGPVFPEFTGSPPKWIIRGRFFERESHYSGEILDWRNTRTGNALITREVVLSLEYFFDQNLGSGGEDRDFFRRMIEMGRVFRWCNEAPVHETIPEYRYRRLFHIRRALLRGRMTFHSPLFSYISVMKAILAIILYGTSLPLLFVFGQHHFMRYLIKTCDHIGLVLTVFKIDIVKEKYLS